VTRRSGPKRALAARPRDGSRRTSKTFAACLPSLAPRRTFGATSASSMRLAPAVRRKLELRGSSENALCTRRSSSSMKPSLTKSRSSPSGWLWNGQSCFRSSFRRGVRTILTRRTSSLSISHDPGVIVGIDSPERASETADYPARAARELNRATREHGIKSGIVDRANARRWLGDEIPRPDPTLRHSAVFAPSRMTVGDLKREILSSPIRDELEALQAGSSSESA
jgi:hypothetical protein